MSENSRRRNPSERPELKPWPKELVDRLNLPVDIYFKHITFETLERMAVYRDAEIQKVVKAYKAEKITELFRGCSEQRFLLTLLDMIDQVPLSLLDEFLEKCPRGQALFDCYAGFLGNSPREEYGTTLNKNFIDFILNTPKE